MSLSSRYAELKKKVGGNREMRRYEETFGQPFEEQAGITGPTKAQKRILNETEFAIALSDSLDGKYDALIDSEISYLEKEMEENGVLTNAACNKAVLWSVP